MSSLESNRVVKTFASLRAEGRKTLLPFLTAGYPDLDTTRRLLGAFEQRGVRICELGIPFSDPIADGPTIQASYTAALSQGINSAGILRMVADYRAAGGEMALLAMVTFSIVYRHGVRQFIREAAEAGVDGLIVPDLSLEEADNFASLCADSGLTNVMLIAPTSPEERKQRIASYSSGFIYYISVAGITGERDRLPEETTRAVAALRDRTDKPVCVGFGISSPQMVRTVCEVADGAIVGSAIVHRITDRLTQGADAIVRDVPAFVAELLAGAE